MAYAASIRGHATVAEAITDPVVRGWVEEWWDEACRHLPLPPEELTAYREALVERFANPRIRHLLAQIAADGSQKIPIRIVPTAHAELASGRPATGALRAIAAWVLHLRGTGAPVTDAVSGIRRPGGAAAGAGGAGDPRPNRRRRRRGGAALPGPRPRDRGRRRRMSAPTHIAVMGVSGCGKSTLAAALATELGAEFGEADLFHPKANVEKMASGHPLTDEDRWPWLDLLVTWMDEQEAAGRHTVLSCSALRRAYRDRLRQARGGVAFVHLAGDKQVILERMRARQGHFMPPALLDSQYATLENLEPDELGMVLDIAGTPTEHLAAALAWVRSLAHG